MSDYGAVYEEQFSRNLRRYAALRTQVKRRVDRVVANNAILDVACRPLLESGQQNSRGY